MSRKLTLGRQLLTVLRDEHGDALADRFLGIAIEPDNTHPKVPHGFYKHFITEHLKLSYNVRNRLRCYKAILLVRERSGGGRLTNAGMRNGDKSTSKRKKGSELNSVKAQGMSWSLLQFFVDEIQCLRSRADSKMLLDKAREMRIQLLEDGWLDEDLPRLEGRAGISWLYRWRQNHHLSIHASG